MGGVAGYLSLASISPYQHGFKLLQSRTKRHTLSEGPSALKVALRCARILKLASLGGLYRRLLPGGFGYTRLDVILMRSLPRDADCSLSFLRVL